MLHSICLAPRPLLFFDITDVPLKWLWKFWGTQYTVHPKLIYAWLEVVRLVQVSFGKGAIYASLLTILYLESILKLFLYHSWICFSEINFVEYHCYWHGMFWFAVTGLYIRLKIKVPFGVQIQDLYDLIKKLLTISNEIISLEGGC